MAKIYNVMSELIDEHDCIIVDKHPTPEEDRIIFRFLEATARSK